MYINGNEMIKECNEEIGIGPFTSTSKSLLNPIISPVEAIKCEDEKEGNIYFNNSVINITINVSSSNPSNIFDKMNLEQKFISKTKLETESKKLSVKEQKARARAWAKKEFGMM